MPNPLRMNRLLLGTAGLTVDESTYVQAVAGAGVSNISWNSRTGLSRNSILWSVHNWRGGSSSLDSPDSTKIITDYSDNWKSNWSQSQDHRIILDEREFTSGSPELVDVFRILSHPSIGTASIMVYGSRTDFDPKWKWPLRISSFPGELQALELNSLRGIWPSNELVQLQEATRNMPRSEMLIMRGGVRDGLLQILSLPFKIRTGHILMIGPLDFRWRDVYQQVHTLMAETQAGAISFFPLPPTGPLSGHLNELVRQISHNMPYDLALTGAFLGGAMNVIDPRMIDLAAMEGIARNLGRRLKLHPPKRSLLLDPNTTNRLKLGWDMSMPLHILGSALESRAGALPFDHESDSGVGLSEIAKAEQEAREAELTEEPRRFVQGELKKLSGEEWTSETRGLVLNREYYLDVFIGPEGEGSIGADQGISEQLFGWEERDSCTLQVIFAEPGQWDDVFTGALELPRRGTSTKCRFAFSPTKPGAFVGRIIMYYRGRILQTALLKSTVMPSEADLQLAVNLPPLSFSIEAEVYDTLGNLPNRRPFDACLVLNHTSTDTPGMTVAGSHSAYFASLDVVRQQMASISQCLSKVALDKRYSADLLDGKSASLLCELANEGSWLYRRLVVDIMNRSSAGKDLADSKYLQIVCVDPDTVLPLEFVYAYPPPPDGGAQVCPNAKAALEKGECPPSCRPDKSPAPHVCPLGFWGLSKVIERHQHNPDLPKSAQVKRDPFGSRTGLLVEGQCLLATSNQIKGESVELLEQVKSAWKPGVNVVSDWEDWKTAIKEKKPILLLALPHSVGVGADIGLEINGDSFKSVLINESFVRGDPDKSPIVLLLGCDTGGAADPATYAKHVAVFRQAQAALVLGTVATILGKHAVKVAADLVRHIVDSASLPESLFGEVLLHVKRNAVKESNFMAMCLVAYGDADWRLMNL